jgi:hypothetical protein
VVSAGSLCGTISVPDLASGVGGCDPSLTTEPPFAKPPLAEPPFAKGANPEPLTPGDGERDRLPAAVGEAKDAGAGVVGEGR